MRRLAAAPALCCARRLAGCRQFTLVSTLQGVLATRLKNRRSTVSYSGAQRRALLHLWAPVTHPRARTTAQQSTKSNGAEPDHIIITSLAANVAAARQQSPGTITGCTCACTHHTTHTRRSRRALAKPYSFHTPIACCTQGQPAPSPDKQAWGSHRRHVQHRCACVRAKNVGRMISGSESHSPHVRGAARSNAATAHDVGTAARHGTDRPRWRAARQQKRARARNE